MTRRFNLFLITAVVVGATMGGVLGDRVLATDDVEARAIAKFARLVDVVETSYPGPVDSQEAVYGAIRGMLRTLDPHSNFLDPKTYQSMRDEQRGHFSGLGIVVTKKGDQLTVISPIEDTPAYRLGIRAGDVIARIEGQATTEMTLDEAVGRLKGPRGTQVSITINRIGSEPSDLTITREDIPTKSVSRAFMVRPGIGYIRIKNFTQTTHDEVTQALQSLEKQGMESLVLDLRYNPGGLLDQAVRISDVFVGKGQTIVYTKGRLPDSNHNFSAESAEQAEQPLVVLVNQGSASASEIVSGAIQDHDRGLIVGETTWGKGLVQSVYQLKYKAGLALTTAKYYTPSGRSIQRDYSHSFEDYYDYDEAQTHPPDLTKPARTDVGRTVYGGGGIHPDVVVATPKPTELEQKLDRNDAFFRFSVAYASKRKDISRQFNTDEKVVEEFKAFLREAKIEFDAEDFARDLGNIKRALDEKMVSAVYGLDEGGRRAVESDPQVLRALELVPQARELRQRSKRLVADGRGTVQPPLEDATRSIGVNEPAPSKR